MLIKHPVEVLVVYIRCAPCAVVITPEESSVLIKFAYLIVNESGFAGTCLGKTCSCRGKCRCRCINRILVARACAEVILAEVDCSYERLSERSCGLFSVICKCGKSNDCVNIAVGGVERVNVCRYGAGECAAGIRNCL